MSSNLNRCFSFLFIKTMAPCFHLDKNYNPEFEKIYDVQIQRYLGFGFFLSFIPGTDAYKARMLLLNEMEFVIENDHFSLKAWLMILFFSRPGLIVVRRILELRNHDFLEMFRDQPVYPHILNIGFYLCQFLEFFACFLKQRTSGLVFLLIYGLLMILALPIVILTIVLEYPLRIAHALLIDPIHFVVNSLLQAIFCEECEFCEIPHAIAAIVLTMDSLAAPEKIDWKDTLSIKNTKADEDSPNNENKLSTEKSLVIACSIQCKQRLEKHYLDYKQASFFKIAQNTQSKKYLKGASPRNYVDYHYFTETMFELYRFWVLHTFSMPKEIFHTLFMLTSPIFTALLPTETNPEMQNAIELQ